MRRQVLLTVRRVFGCKMKKEEARLLHGGEFCCALKGVVEEGKEACGVLCGG